MMMRFLRLGLPLAAILTTALAAPQNGNRSPSYSYERQCGKPNDDPCPYGQECIKDINADRGPKRWYCRPQVNPTLTVTLTDCYPTDEPPPPPFYGYAQRCGMPNDNPCAYGEECVKTDEHPGRHWNCMPKSGPKVTVYPDYCPETSTYAPPPPSSTYVPPPPSSTYVPPPPSSTYVPPPPSSTYVPPPPSSTYVPPPPSSTYVPPPPSSTYVPPPPSSTYVPPPPSSTYVPPPPSSTYIPPPPSSTYVPPPPSSTYVPPPPSSTYVPPPPSSTYVPPPPSSSTSKTSQHESSTYGPPPTSSTSYVSPPPTSSSSSHSTVSHSTSHSPTSDSTSHPPTSSSTSSSTSHPPTSSSTSSTLTSSSSSSSTSSNPGPTYTPVVGVPNRVVPRRPIQVLQSEYPDVFNMYILAMDAIQKMAEDDDISWYQISGIHGFPQQPWQYPPESVVSPGYGYCAHRSAIFLTWHRPYIVLVEQVLHKLAMEIAEKFAAGSDRDRWVAAADDVRHPYWDWAADDLRSRIPDVMSQPRIDVTSPDDNGSPNIINIRNPLFNYAFQTTPAPSSGLLDTTVRSQNANAFLQATFPSRQAATLNLFTHDVFNVFNDECEGIHDEVHVNIGEDMAAVPTAAFDPIFWLHHCQVDRLLALYQASHPGVYLSPTRRSFPTLALPFGGTDDLLTPLYPFRHASGREWTSDDVKDVSSIWQTGYTYPEIPQDLDQTSLQAHVTERINELYGPDLASADTAAASVSTFSTSSTTVEANNDTVVSTQAENDDGDATTTIRTEWSILALYDPEELPGSYKINFYLGTEGTNAVENIGEVSSNLDDLFGVAAIFSTPEPMEEPHASVTINQTVPLTPALEEKGIALEPGTAVDALTQRLWWSVERVDRGAPMTIALEALASLRVGVVRTTAVYAADGSRLPDRVDPVVYIQPTEGKTGGVEAGEESPVEGAPVELGTDE